MVPGNNTVSSLARRNIVSRNLYAAKNAQVWQPDAEPLGGGGVVMGTCMKKGVSRARKTIEFRFWLKSRVFFSKECTKNVEDFVRALTIWIAGFMTMR